MSGRPRAVGDSAAVEPSDTYKGLARVRGRVNRRQVLASAALLPAAGCIGPLGGDGSRGMGAELPTASLAMEAVSDADVARKLTHHELPDDEREALDRILDGERTTGWHLEPPVHTATPALHEGTVYRLSSAVVESKPATRYSVTVDVPDRTPAPDEGVQFEDLPAADREQFAALGLEDGGFVGFGTTFVYTPVEAEQSVLVPDTKYRYIRWDDGTTATWAVDDGWETELQRYRYEVERSVPASEYGAGVREAYAFELSGLADAERDVVETAIEDEHGYTVETEATPSPAFERLADRFQHHEEVAVHDEPSPGRSGRYLVRFDGRVYWTRLRVSERRATATDD